MIWTKTTNDFLDDLYEKLNYNRDKNIKRE